MDDLKSELTGKFEKLIVAMMKPSRLYDAYELKHALKVKGCRQGTLLSYRVRLYFANYPVFYLTHFGEGCSDKTVGVNKKERGNKPNNCAA